MPKTAIYERAQPNPPDFIKFLLVMKLTLFFLLLSVFNVQAKGYSQVVSLNVKNASLEVVLSSIEKQTGFVSIYTDALLKEAARVTITADKKPLNEFLVQLFSNQPIAYNLKGRTIVLFKKNERKVTVSEEERPLLNEAPLIAVQTISGRITDSLGRPLEGVSLKLTPGGKGAATNKEGVFTIQEVPAGRYRLEISLIGYTPLTKNITVTDQPLYIGNTVLQVQLHDMADITVSTGYERISKERATGSFEYLDSTVINRGVSPSILQRIEDMTPGLMTLRNRSSVVANEASFAIRGRSTIFSNVEPLIVVDNYPFEGDINSINPNDVESVTVLKDAAATSVWGARGGNGVLVITLKKGKFNQAPVVNYNASFTSSKKENLYSVPQLSSSEFIDVQRFLYNRGMYPYTAPAPGDIVSPVVEILNRQRHGSLSAAEAEAMLNQLRAYDVRDDITKYVQGNPFSQQHSLSLSGGGIQNRYYLSVGYDQSRNSDRSTSDRKSISFSENFSFLNNRLQANAKIVFSESANKGTNYSLPNEVLYPYTRLADENGTPLEIPYLYSKTQINNLAGGKLIEMTHIPLDEFGYGRRKGRVQDYSLNADLSYNFTSALKLLVSYQLGQGVREQNNIHDVESFYTRELVNRYTSYNAATGLITQNFPNGGMNTITNGRYINHNGRTQLTYNKRFGLHDISVLAGAEIRHTNTITSTERLLGYSKEFGTSMPYNATTLYQNIFNGAMMALPIVAPVVNNTNRYVSRFANTSYTFANRYTVSGSVRKDESNLYGVRSNQKGVPLWSAGVSWIINQESFYDISWLPSLRLRATNGSSGNTNAAASGQTIAIQGTGVNYGLGPFYRIMNPANPDLKWERVNQVNVGIDFGFAKNIVSGSFEIFKKHGKDLIAGNPVAPQVGVINFTGNFADIETKGFDLSLQFRQINKKDFSWSTRVILSSAIDKITKFKIEQYPQTSVSNNSGTPREGYPYSAIFTFRYGGLNAFGAPMLISNGMPTTDIAGVVNSGLVDDIFYVGSFNAKYSGSITNDFKYKNVSLSFIIAYRMGHYFKRSHINYQNLFRSNVYKISEFNERWQVPGDERFTDVPVMEYPVNNAAQVAYSSSNAVLEKADNFRLQDIRLSYTMTKNNVRGLPFKSLDLYLYMSNMGVIWKATKYDVDPHRPGLPKEPKLFSFGLRTNI